MDAQNTFAIAVAGRGFDARISTEWNVGLPDSACVYCGNCIGVCPTGALMFRSEHEMREAGTWDESAQTVTDTICPYCGVGCTLSLHVQDNEIVRVTSPMDSSVTDGHLCIKGRFGFQFVQNRGPTGGAGGPPADRVAHGPMPTHFRWLWYLVGLAGMALTVLGIIGDPRVGRRTLGILIPLVVVVAIVIGYALVRFRRSLDAALAAAPSRSGAEGRAPPATRKPADPSAPTGRRATNPTGDAGRGRRLAANAGKPRRRTRAGRSRR